MKLSYKNKLDLQPNGSYLIIVDRNPNWSEIKLPRGVKGKLKDRWKRTTKKLFERSNGHRVVMLKVPSGDGHKNREALRKAGAVLHMRVSKWPGSRVNVINHSGSAKASLDLAEGLALANYQFLKYRADADKKKHGLNAISIGDESATRDDVQELENLVNATCIARDLVNEPLSYLTAEQYSTDIRKLGKEFGFKVQVFNKKKIQDLGMGGLLAVNLGAPNPPTFNILEWKPSGAVNEKPIVLVGKGVVYDTGGLSLKPTPNSMDIMKCDMGGSAAVVGAMVAVSANALPLHVVGLIPATENRPGGNAYAPGDVITMYSGKTVEVMNTDAEGRMILADALHYAKQYDPELVIDLATLTGAAMRAIGPEGTVAVCNDGGEEHMADLKESGNQVYERIAQFPFWDEYGEQIKSDIADIKNIGGANAGMITAGKFLEHFTDYPWIHLDVAGPAWRHATDGYRLKGGTGVGVRLLYDFLRKRTN